MRNCSVEVFENEQTGAKELFKRFCDPRTATTNVPQRAGAPNVQSVKLKIKSPSITTVKPFKVTTNSQEIREKKKTK